MWRMGYNERGCAEGGKWEEGENGGKREER